MEGIRAGERHLCFENITNMLTISHISKTFDRHCALSDVSFHVRKGSMFGLLGPNGAGKTTLLRIVNRIVAPDSGEVMLDGLPLAEADTGRIGYMPEERGLYKRMKVGEQLVYLARLKGMGAADAERSVNDWLERFSVADWKRRRLCELSKGMQQKVQFIATVVHQPLLIFFDEPFSGFDPVNAELLREQMCRLRDEGATIVISSHNMSSVESMCDDVALLNDSHLVYCGSLNELKDRNGGKSLNEIFINTMRSAQPR